MATDIRLEDQRIFLEGGEAQSTGGLAGYAFQDRSQSGRWVLYAQAGPARLFTDGKGDVVTVDQDGQVSTHGVAAGYRFTGRSAPGQEAIWHCDNDMVNLEFTGPLKNGQVGERLVMSFNDLRGLTVFNTAQVTGEFVAQGNSRFQSDVQVGGDLHVDGQLTQSSTLAVKDDVEELSTGEAMAVLEELCPVTFRYQSDARGTRKVGFIAEHAPELVVNPERDRMSPMDVAAVLTKAVQEQGRLIEALSQEVRQLRDRLPEEGSP